MYMTIMTATPMTAQNLPVFQGELPAGKVGVVENREYQGHAFQVFAVVEHQRFAERFSAGFQILLVDVNQLSAGIGILAEYA